MGSAAAQAEGAAQVADGLPPRSDSLTHLLLLKTCVFAGEMEAAGGVG